MTLGITLGRLCYDLLPHPVKRVICMLILSIDSRGSNFTVEILELIANNKYNRVYHLFIVWRGKRKR